MFYPVRVRDASGKIKKVVSSRQLSRDYWRQFDNILNGEMARKKTRKNKSGPSNDSDEMEPGDIKK